MVQLTRDFLGERCGGDAELLAAVRDLLKVDFSGDDIHVAGEDLDWTGKTFSRYRVLEKIGKGGVTLRINPAISGAAS